MLDVRYLSFKFKPQRAQSPSPSSGREHEGSLKMKQFENVTIRVSYTTRSSL